MLAGLWNSIKKIWVQEQKQLKNDKHEKKKIIRIELKTAWTRNGYWIGRWVDVF